MPDLELVYWRDANFYKDEPVDLEDDYIVKTVGWIEESDEKWLTIRSEKLPKSADLTWRSVTRVPVNNVVKRVKLRKK